MEAGGQVLGGDGCPTDEPSKALTHGQCLGQLPEREENDISLKLKVFFNVVHFKHPWEHISYYSYLCFLPRVRWDHVHVINVVSVVSIFSFNSWPEGEVFPRMSNFSFRALLLFVFESSAKTASLNNTVYFQAIKTKLKQFSEISRVRLALTGVICE